MTPAAKEGLPAVVGELVAKAETLATVVSNLIAARQIDMRYGEYVTDLTATLSALTAEAGKGDEDERAAFETWATENGHRTLRDRINPDRYADNVTVIAWIAWQGALDYADTLALSTATPAGECNAAIELLRELRTARPLILYGDAWIDRIEKVLAASPRGADAGEG